MGYTICVVYHFRLYSTVIRSEDMSKKLTCAFTGHCPSSYRFGYDEEHPDCAKIKILMATQIGALIGNGVRTFLTGMALGADLWSAEIVLRFKKDYPDIRLIAVLPCETQADKWSVEQRERYFNILAECDETVYISRHYTKDCIFERNRWIIDHSTFVIAVYNGTPKGGTAYVVKYAYSQHCYVIIINPETFEIVPYTIVVSKDCI